MRENGLSIQEVSLALTGAILLFLFHGDVMLTIVCCVCIRHSTLTTEVVPSFILLAIQGSKVVTYVYELHGDQVDVSKSEFSKA